MQAFERFGARDQEHNRRRFEQIIGKSPALETVLEQVERVTPMDFHRSYPASSALKKIHSPSATKASISSGHEFRASLPKQRSISQ